MSLKFVFLMIICIMPTATRLVAAETDIPVIDLKTWNFTKEPVIRTPFNRAALYWQKLLSPAEVINEKPDGIRNVTGTWDDQVGKVKLTNNSWLTFAFYIDLPIKHPPLRFKLNDALDSYRVWINDELRAEVGTVATTREEAVPAISNRSILIGENQGQILVVINQSAYFHRNGGTRGAVVLGLEQTIENDERQKLALDMFLLSCGLIMGLYHLLLFLIRKKGNLPALGLGLYFLAVAIRVGSTASSRIFVEFLNIDYNTNFFLEYSSFYIAVPSLFIFFYGMFPHEFHRRVIHSIVGIATIFLILVVAFPLRVYSYTVSYFQIYTLLTIVYGFSCISLAVYHRRQGAQTILIASAILTIATVNDILYSMQAVRTFNAIGFALYFLILCQSFVLARVFAQAFADLEDSQETIKDLNSKLQRHIESLDHLVEEKTRNIRSMLDNIPQGVFRVLRSQESFKIDQEYSKSLLQILNTKDLEDDNPFDAIFGKSDLSSSDLANIKSVFLTTIGENALQWQANFHILPRNFSLGSRIIEADWSPILDEEDNVEKILCVLKDVTEERSLQNKIIREAQGSQVLQEIARVHSFSKVEKFLETAFGYLSACTSEADEKALIFRNIHTLKGLAMIYGFKLVSDFCHELEDKIRDWSHAEDSSQDFNAPLTQSFEELSRILDGYQQALHDIYGDTKGKLSIEKKDLEHVEFMIINHQPDKALKRLIFLHEYNMERALEDELDSISSLAKRLGKHPPKFKFINDQYILDTKMIRTLRSSFIHILRNSIDHGIEKPDERLKLGKDESGLITFRIDVQSDLLTIHYRDDGRGLDLASLRQKKEQREGPMTHNPSHSELANLMFESGISTAWDITQLSGRGVGMEAVKRFIETEGGEIRIELGQPHAMSHRYPFTLVLQLPIKTTGVAFAS